MPDMYTPKPKGLGPREALGGLDNDIAEMLREDGHSEEEITTVLKDPQLKVGAYIHYGSRIAPDPKTVQVNMQEDPTGKILEYVRKGKENILDPAVEYGSASVPLALAGSSLGPGGALAGGLLGAGLAFGANKLTGQKPKAESLQNVLNLLPSSAAAKLLPLLKSNALRQGVGTAIDNALASGGDAVMQGKNPIGNMAIGGMAGGAASVIPGVFTKGIQAAGSREAVRNLLEKYKENNIVRNISGKFVNIDKKRDASGRFISAPKEEITENAEALLGFEDALTDRNRQVSAKTKALMEEYATATSKRKEDIKIRLLELSEQQDALSAERLEKIKLKKQQLDIPGMPRDVLDRRVQELVPSVVSKPKSQLTREAISETPVPDILKQPKSELKNIAENAIPIDPIIPRGESLKSRGLDWKSLTPNQRELVRKVHQQKPEVLYKKVVSDLFSSETFPQSAAKGQDFKEAIQNIVLLEGENAPTTVLPKLRKAFISEALDPKYAGKAGYANPDSLKKLIESTGPETVNAIFGNKKAFDDFTKVLNSASRLGLLGKRHALADERGLRFWGIPIAGPKKLFADAEKHPVARLAAGGALATGAEQLVGSKIANTLGYGTAAASVYNITWDRFAEAVLGKDGGSRFKKYMIEMAEPLARNISRRISNVGEDLAN